MRLLDLSSRSLSLCTMRWWMWISSPIWRIASTCRGCLRSCSSETERSAFAQQATAQAHDASALLSPAAAHRMLLQASASVVGSRDNMPIVLCDILRR